MPAMGRCRSAAKRRLPEVDASRYHVNKRHLTGWAGGPANAQSNMGATFDRRLSVHPPTNPDRLLQILLPYDRNPYLERIIPHETHFGRGRLTID